MRRVIPQDPMRRATSLLVGSREITRQGGHFPPLFIREINLEGKISTQAKKSFFCLCTDFALLIHLTYEESWAVTIRRTLWNLILSKIFEFK